MCCRCFGVVLGAFMTSFAVGDAIQSVAAALVLALPATIDWSLQRFALIESTNRRRLSTGLLLGVACVLAPVPW